MTIELPPKPCAKCARPLGVWRVTEGRQWRDLYHWLEGKLFEPLPTGPYCWKCFREITEKVMHNVK